LPSSTTIAVVFVGSVAPQQRQQKQQQQQQQQQEILAPSRKKQKTKTNRHTPGTGFVPIALRCSNTETTARIRVVVCLFVCLFVCLPVVLVLSNNLTSTTVAALLSVRESGTIEERNLLLRHGSRPGLYLPNTYEGAVRHRYC